MSDIQALEHQISLAKELVEQRDRMVKLSANPEFRKLIIEGFCRDECARYVHVSVDGGLSPQDRADALAAAQAAGHLKTWMNALILMGNNAEGSIFQAEEVLAELRAEPEAE